MLTGQGMFACPTQNKERDLEDNLLHMEKKEEIAKRSRKVKELRDGLRGVGLEAYDQ